MRAIDSEEARLIGTLFTGTLLVERFSIFQEWIEELMGEPIYTHEFTSNGRWEEMRQQWLERALESIGAKTS